MSEVMKHQNRITSIAFSSNFIQEKEPVNEINKIKWINSGAWRFGAGRELKKVDDTEGAH